jgi:hypothetical protein
MDTFSNIKHAVGQLRATVDDAFSGGSFQERELRLAQIIVSAVKGKISPDWLLREAAAILSAESAIIWVQRGGDAWIATAGVTHDDGRELFVKVIPYLAEQNAINALFSTDDKHYAAYSHTVRTADGELTDNVMAAAFVRDLSDHPFTDDEAALGSLLTEALFDLVS